jgi:hypothetical protein
MRARFCTLGFRISLLVITPVFACGCLAEPKYNDPTMLVAPYDTTQVWAVAPFLNESGVSDVNGADIADIFADQAADVDGVTMLAVNRVINAMRYLDIERVTTVGDARLLMNALDVDGLVVGTVTSYDPYRPPRLGMAVQLHTRPAYARSSDLDTIALTRASTDYASPGTLGPGNPVAQAAGVFDASNHRIQQQLMSYARGRTERDTAYGDDIYLVSMDLYTQFVSYRLLSDLLDAEWNRESADRQDP